ncbi:hypothetical protein ACN4EE_05395 [Geminocystis sp. CENA526]|uniref:hypothetical protein n=1 Tax=Geminocystis sp. CENA526 TaxID=1355871 RepID=UPI003D6DD762
MKKFIQFKLYLQLYSNKHQKYGFTMLEAMATLLIGSLILGFAFSGFLSARQIFLSDRAKVEANQRLRTIFTTIGPDIQQTGEGLVSDPKLPAIEITEVTIPDSTEKTSEIIVRKAVSPLFLNLCTDITANTTSSPNVIDNSDPNDNFCKVNDFQPIDGWPDTLKKWRDLRQSNGDTLYAYIYDQNGGGEFFDYTGEEILDEDGEDMTPSVDTPPHTVNLTTNNHTWTREYLEGSVIYLIDERKYRVVNNNLQLVLNNSQVLDIVENVDKLDITVTLQIEMGGTEYVCRKIPPTVSGDCTPNFPTDTEYSWAQIKSINVTAKILPGEDTNSTTAGVLQEEDLSLTQKFFPRNRLSF